jgi:hypothetical protein
MRSNDTTKPGQRGQSAAATNEDSRRNEHLLDRIRAIRAEVATEIKDEEFTQLLEKSHLSAEAGFTFVSYGDRFVMLSVPEQDTVNWYPEKGWIVPAKVEIGRAIAAKYGLSLYEPPDVEYSPYFRPELLHHLELSSRKETIVIAHPQYLKIRLIAEATLPFSTVPVYQPFSLGPHLLQDLAALYKAGP